MTTEHSTSNKSRGGWLGFRQKKGVGDERAHHRPSDTSRVGKLVEEKAELTRRLERQRRSLEYLVALFHAKEDPLDTLPLEPDNDDLEDLSPQEASLITITNLRAVVEHMEEERTELCVSLTAIREENEELRKKNLAQAELLQSMEDLCHALGQVSVSPDNRKFNRRG